MTTDQKGSFLTAEERTVCERVSAANETPHSQRAQLLLVLDEGITQKEASELTGLTRGQVNYIVRQFRQKKLSIFPEHLQSSAALAKPEPAVESKPEPESQPVEATTPSTSPAEAAPGPTKKSKKDKAAKKKASKKSKKDKTAKKKKRKEKKKKDKKSKKDKK